jgi:hypothetical protein
MGGNLFRGGGLGLGTAAGGAGVGAGGLGLGGAMGQDYQANYDMVNALLAGGMQAAGQSQSPWVAGLAPVVSAMIGGRNESRYDAARDAASKEQIAALMAARDGSAGSTEQLLAMMLDPSASPQLRSLASPFVNNALFPKPVGGGGVAGGGVAGGGIGPSMSPAQINSATNIIQDAMAGYINMGLTQDEALLELAKNPLYQPMIRNMGLDSQQIAGGAEAAIAAAMQAEEDRPGFWGRLFGRGGEEAPAATPDAAQVAPAPRAPAAADVRASVGGGLAQPTSQAEYDALPSGTSFRAPDGSIRTKP